jgi:SlyX protein
MNEQRLVELETKITFQDHLLETLNKVVSEQQQTIDTIEKQLKVLALRMNPTSDVDIGPANEKPPHY